MVGGEQGDEPGIDRISGPAVGRGGEVGAHIPTFFAGAHEAQQGGADRVLLGFAGELQRLQGVFVAAPRPLDGARPAAVVGFVEFREQAGQGGFGGGLHLIRQAGFQALIAAALQHPGAIDDLRHQHPQAVFRLRAPGLHAATGFCAFAGGGDALAFQGLGSGALGGDLPGQFIGAGFAHEQMNGRAVLPGGAGVRQHTLLARAPAIPHP